MREITFEKLIRRAFDTQERVIFDKNESEVYTDFLIAEKKTNTGKGKPAPTEDFYYKFERVRLGIACALVKIYIEMSEDQNKQEILDLLIRATEAKSTQEIDKIMEKDMSVFENLYSDIIMDEDKEMVLDLFDRTLEAASINELDKIAEEALDLLEEINY